MAAIFYADIIATTVAEVGHIAGPGLTVLAFKLGPPGVTDHQNKAQLLEFANRARERRPREAKEMAISVLAQSETFLEELKNERLRQASESFNVAKRVAIVGTCIMLAGVVLMWFSDVKKAGVTAASGVVINTFGLLSFRLNRDTNDRLDKLAQLLGKVRGRKELLKKLGDPGDA